MLAANPPAPTPSRSGNPVAGETTAVHANRSADFFFSRPEIQNLTRTRQNSNQAVNPSPAAPGSS
jgi:hypothetical protein